jgi:hypothetical protein
MSDSPILDDLVRDLNVAGLVGVDSQSIVVYLCNISRKLGRPQSYLATGPSSAGKSFMLSRLLELVPGEDVETFDSVSETALFYKTTPLTHKVVYVPETATLTDEVQSFLRVLVSEGSLRREYTVLKGTEREVRTASREGPCLVAQSTVDGIHPENETRSLIVEIPDDAEQTRRVMRASARAAAGLSEPIDVKRWHNLDAGLPTEGASVQPALADRLADLVFAGSVRMRRDFTALMTLMMAHALVYAGEREPDHLGRVMADVRDYAAIRPHLLVVMGVQSDAVVSAQVRQFVQATEAALDEKREAAAVVAGVTVTAKEVGERIGLDSRTAWRRAKRAIRDTWLENEEKRPRQPARLILGEPMPIDVEVLPPVEALFTDAAADATRSRPDSMADSTDLRTDSTDSTTSRGRGEENVETSFAPPMGPEIVESVESPHERVESAGGIDADWEVSRPDPGETLTLDCADYRAHQSDHVFRDGRWMCQACVGIPA